MKTLLAITLLALIVVAVAPTIFTSANVAMVSNNQDAGWLIWDGGQLIKDAGWLIWDGGWLIWDGGWLIWDGGWLIWDG